jgi:hypothetical protein
VSQRISMKGVPKTCSECFGSGHNKRTCARRAAAAQGRLFDDSPPPPPPVPDDLGPWRTCPAGDPFCPGVGCTTHAA